MISKVLLLSSFAYAGEGTGHSHGPEFSMTQLVGVAVIAIVVMAVLYFLSKKVK